jgi:hypothetical protein
MKVLKIFLYPGGPSTVGLAIVGLFLGGIYRNWPAMPGGTTFKVVPIEEHAKVAVSLLRNGDTLEFAPDGKTHFWAHGLWINTSASNLTFNGGGTRWCSGAWTGTELLDESKCDVVITEPDYGQDIFAFKMSMPQNNPKP